MSHFASDLDQRKRAALYVMVSLFFVLRMPLSLALALWYLVSSLDYGSLGSVRALHFSLCQTYARVFVTIRSPSSLTQAKDQRVQTYPR